MQNTTLCDVDNERLEHAFYRALEIRDEIDIPMLDISVTNRSTGKVTEFRAVFDSSSRSCRFSLYEGCRCRGGSWSKTRFCKWMVDQFGAHVSRAHLLG